uniref:Protein son of sevenless n=1 Tax=Cacopsylla melanoneura TaxID=428564 RepID=A0A8D9E1V9_9HEMI
MYMFSSQLTLADFNDNCDFHEAYHENRWKGMLVSSLHSILKQVHNSLEINMDALYYTEQLILKLLNLLCSKPLPLTTSDIKEKIRKYFPNPISEWSFNEAKQALEKGKKKSTLVLSIDRVHTILQKEFYFRKVDTNLVLYYAAVLDYIAADLLKLVGNYVKNIRKMDISIQDIDVAMYADRALLELFFQEDDDPIYQEPQVQPNNLVLNYREVVLDFVSEEKLFIRELKLILKIFYEELNKITPLEEIKEVHSLFEIIEEIYNLTVCLLGAVEDISEMSSDDHCIGSCFEEFAEDAEFDVYEKLVHNIINQRSIEALSTHVTQPSILNRLQFAGFGFKECVKYYLPTLLMSPLYHCNLYFEYIKIFHSLTNSEKDKECLEQAQGVLAPLQMRLSKISLEKNAKNACVRNYNRVKHLQSLDKIQELKKNVDGLDVRELRSYFKEFYREDTLMKYDGKSNRLTERKVYFFDGILLLCKSNKKNSVTVPINVVSSQYEFKCKEMFFLRKVEINDVENTDEIKNAFEIAPRDQPSIIIVTKSPEEKKSWFSDLIMVNTKSMLDRTLDSIIIDDEKKHPLRMPSSEYYNFAEPDSPENIILEEKQNTTRPLIKGATLHKLIERLTYHIYSDPSFIEPFLTTYRSFSTPSELLDLLIDRFNVPEPSKVFGYTSDDMDNSTLREDINRYKKEFCQPVQFRVLNVFRKWVQHHFYDFQRDQTLLEKLKSFLLNEISGKVLRKWADSVLILIERKETDEEKEITFAFNNSPPPVEVHGSINSVDEFNILMAHPVEIARQLTVLEFDYFRAVKPSELVGSVWTKKNKADLSPNLIKIMKHTTNFTRWLEKIIVEAENFDERLAIMTRIIEMMVVLQKLNNFNGVLAVTSAMGSAAVYRLRFTFQALPTRLQRVLEEARDLNGDHFKKYQEKLRNINPPCIPFFGMYLTNILHIEEGNPDFLPDSKLINFTKRRKVAEIISEIQQYQNEPYCLNVVPVYREFFETLSPFEGKS